MIYLRVKEQIAMIYFLKKFFPTLLIIICILFLSLASFRSVTVEPIVPYMDKIVHGCMYFGFSLVLLFDLIRTNPHLKVKKIYLLETFITASLFGGLMEILQASVTTSRQAEWMDMGANMTGALAGIIIGYFILPTIIKYLNIRICRIKKPRK